jgi:hypothetical protein
MHFLRPVGYWRHEVRDEAWHLALPYLTMLRADGGAVGRSAARVPRVAGGLAAGATVDGRRGVRGDGPRPARCCAWPSGATPRRPPWCSTAAPGKRRRCAGARSPSRWTPAGTCSRCGSRPPMSRTARRLPRCCRRCRRSPPTASRWRLWTRATPGAARRRSRPARRGAGGRQRNAVSCCCQSVGWWRVRSPGSPSSGTWRDDERAPAVLAGLHLLALVGLLLARRLRTGRPRA